RSLNTSSPVEKRRHLSVSGLCVRKTKSPMMIADDRPSGICGNVHLRCVLVTSPVPVASTHTALPPRPLSEKTRLRAKAGDDASPSAVHHQIISPLSG